MDIEELVKKQLLKRFFTPDDMATAIRAALTEQAETHAMELRAYETTVQNLEQRIRELEVQSASVGIIDSNCSYLPFAGRVCNKCGRIHDGGKSVVGE